jgi:hypothetical protein
MERLQPINWRRAMFLLPIEPRTNEAHAISVFKLVTDENCKEVHPVHMIAVMSQTVMALEMTKNGTFEQYKIQMINEEREDERRRQRELESPFTGM